MNSTEATDVPVSDEPTARPKDKAKAKPVDAKRATAAPKTTRPRTLADALKLDKPSALAYAGLAGAALVGILDWPVALLGAGAWAIARASR